MYITSGVGFLADLDILFTGTNDKGTETLLVRETFERGNPDNPTSEVLTVGGDDLTRFLNHLPTNIRVEPVVIIGDGAEEEIIETDHFVSVDSVVFLTEPRLTVLSETRIDPDPEDVSFRDSEVRDKIKVMVDLCPSGTLAHALDESSEVVEPELPKEIGVVADGPLWVSGRITVERRDGKPIEVRNRITLCRCGQSANKPFCDGMHKENGFKDG